MQYFLANDIADGQKQVAVFLTVIGAETYSLLRNLMAPEKPSSKPITDLISILKKHLNPQPIVIAERFKCYERNQQPDEYLDALRKLTEYCEFDRIHIIIIYYLFI